MFIKIKYLGIVNKIIDQLKNQKIIFKAFNESMELNNHLMSPLKSFKFPFKTKYYEQDFYVSSNNFSAYKLIESWLNWS